MRRQQVIHRRRDVVTWVHVGGRQLGAPQAELLPEGAALQLVDFVRAEGALEAVDPHLATHSLPNRNP